MNKVTLLLICVIALLGCQSTNPQNKFYEPYVDLVEYGDIYKIEESDPVVVTTDTDNYQNALKEYESKNYVVIGQSFFRGNEARLTHVKAHAKKVSASLVIHSSSYSDSYTSTAMIPMMNSSTTLINTPQGLGSATTNSTTYIPVSKKVHQYRTRTAYLAERSYTHPYGLFCRDTSHREKQELSVNTGCMIHTVLYNSPAYLADLTRGALIVSINGQRVLNRSHADDLMFNSYVNNESIDIEWLDTNGAYQNKLLELFKYNPN